MRSIWLTSFSLTLTNKHYQKYESNDKTAIGGLCRGECQDPHELVQALPSGIGCDGVETHIQSPSSAHHQVSFGNILHRPAANGSKTKVPLKDVVPLYRDSENIVTPAELGTDKAGETR